MDTFFTVFIFIFWVWLIYDTYHFYHKLKYLQMRMDRLEKEMGILVGNILEKNKGE